MFTRFHIAFISIGLTVSLSASPLEFRLPEDISWKAVFDGGFRPKHISGLQHRNTECIDQEVDLIFGEHPEFRLDRGRLMFELQSDESIRLIEHVSRVSITMAEGKIRLDSFHRLFDGFIVRQGIMPIMIDPVNQRIMAVSDQFAVAEVNNFNIFYGFNSAMTSPPRLLPVLTVVRKVSMKGPQLPIRRKIVEPPPGYEWYSLDPKIDTPGPGIPPVVKPVVVPPGLSSGKPPQRLSPYMQELERKIERGVFGLVVGVVCIVLLPIIWWLVRGRAKNEG